MELKIEDKEQFFANFLLREQRIGDSKRNVPNPLRSIEQVETDKIQFEVRAVFNRAEGNKGVQG